MKDKYGLFTGLFIKNLIFFNYENIINYIKNNYEKLEDKRNDIKKI